MDDCDWIELFRDLMPPLYRRVSRSVGGRRELAEDVVQETWLRALSDWRAAGLPRDPAAWLGSVASNLLRNHYRRQQTRSEGSLDEGRLADPLGSEPDDQLADRERSLARADALQRGLARLRPEQAQLLEERYLQGTSSSELATRRGLSERAVEGRLRRARGALARHIDLELLPGTDTRHD